MSLQKYIVTVSAHFGKETKTRTMEVNADNENAARSIARSFTGPLWEVSKVEHKGNSNIQSGRKGFVASHD